MEKNLFMLAAIAALFFICIKTIEQKYILQDHEKGMKWIFRDAIMVYIGCIGAFYAHHMLFQTDNRLMDVPVLTDMPDMNTV